MTLVRKPADPFRADVQRGERSPWDGEIVTTCDSARRMHMGPDDWNDFHCELAAGHDGQHIHDEDYRWDDDPWEDG